MKFNKIFRTELISLLFLLLALVTCYFLFLFEYHLKVMIERSAFEALGSEVNIDKIKIRPFEEKIEIFRTQITDFDRPERNIVEINFISLSYDTSILFYGSFVSDLVQVKDIKFHSDRAKPGRLLSKEKRLVRLSDPTTHRVNDRLKENLKKTAFSDLVDSLSGKDSSALLKRYQDQLGSIQLSQKADEDLKSLKKDVSALKNKKDFEVLKKKLKGFKFETGSTAQSIESSQKAKALLKEVKAFQKEVEKEVSAIKLKARSFKSLIESSPEKLLKDVQALKSDFDLKKLSPEVITSELLSGYFSLQLDQVSRAQQSLKGQAFGDYSDYVDPKNLPTKKKESQYEVSQVEIEKKKEEIYSEKGVNFIFYKEKVYPTYWLKRIEISSKASKGQDLGDVTGLITDFSSHPEVLSKPLKVDVKGSVPAQNIGAFSVLAAVDHRNLENKTENLSLDVSDYLIKGLKLFSDNEKMLKIIESYAQTSIQVDKKEDSIKLQLKQSFHEPSYDYKSDREIVGALLEKFKEKRPNLNVKLMATGKISNPKLRLSSNLGKVILDLVKETAKRKLQSMLDQKKAILNEKIKDQLGPYGKDLDLISMNANSYKAEIKSILEKELKKIKSKNKDQVKEKAKDALKKLFKKF